MTISRDQAVAIATANAPAGGYTDAQVQEWADWAISNPDVIYSPDPGAQMANAMVASQAAASQAAASQGNYEVAAAETPRSSYTPIDYNQAAQSYQTADYYTPPETVPYREDVNYTQLFGALGKSIEEGGTPPTAEDINRAFEVYLGRPADMPGITGYLNSGKSLEQINADLAYASLYNRETALAPNVEYYEAPTEAQLELIRRLGGAPDTIKLGNLGDVKNPLGISYVNPNTFNYAGFEITPSEITQAYLDYFGYAPTADDLTYWTQIYTASPDVRFSADPRAQIFNAIAAAGGRSDLVKPIKEPKLEPPKPLGPGEAPQYGSQPGLAALPEATRFLPEGGRSLATTPYDAGTQLQGPLGLFRIPTGYVGAPSTLYMPPPVPPAPPAPPVAPVTETTAPVDAIEAVEGMKKGGDVEAAGSRALTPAEIGSRFDISEFIDDEGRLISGYSRPIRDQFGTILGYEDRPYARDVVFNPILARREEEERQRMRSMAKGGLADVAQELASKGRFGDTILAHINPQEAGLLKALGGSGTINPETGLPEFAKIFGIELFPKKGINLNFGPLGNIKIGPKSSGLLQAAAALAIGDYANLSAAQSALAYAGVRTAATGNLMEGIQAGLTAYGLGSAYNSLAKTPIGTASGTAGTGAVNTGAGAGAGAGAVEGVAVDPGTVTSQQVPVATGADAGFNIANAPGAGYEFGPGIEFGPGGEQIITGTGGPLPGPEIITPSPTGAVYGKMSLPAANAGAAAQAGTEAAKQGFLRETLPASVQKYTPDFLLDASGTTLATGTVLGGSLLAGQQERAAYAGQKAALARAEEEERKRGANLANQLFAQYPFEYAKGGVASLAGGGMTYMEAGGTTGPTGEPRDVTGTGDGMSDSVPASIEGVQEARLADGEFVIPADVVADIGNGSSDAGSKKLYDMMDRIRKARHGTTKQPPEIKAERLMPA